MHHDRPEVHAVTQPRPNLDRLRRFVGDLADLLDAQPDEPRILAVAGERLADLVAHDDWLPDACAEPDPLRYRQYRLYRDPDDRFSIVSFVWGPGQATPIHDHTVWGLVGVLRGAELSQAYARENLRLTPSGPARRLAPGEVEAVSPAIGDIHSVANAYDDRPSVSIHVYGADIGAVSRGVYDAAGRRKPFVSGYSNATAPDLIEPPARTRP
jgi:predicted metal-dependent enzyme (double-stranded beta helix superfamily)